MQCTFIHENSSIDKSALRSCIEVLVMEKRNRFFLKIH